MAAYALRATATNSLGWWFGVICALIGLAVAEPALSDEKAFDGAYAGKRVRTKGSGPGCPTEDDVSVTIQGGALTYTHSVLHNFALGFDPHQDGSFSETYSDAGGSFVLMQGRIVGNVLEADVTNGPCEHHWHLTKKPAMTITGRGLYAPHIPNDGIPSVRLLPTAPAWSLRISSTPPARSLWIPIPSA